MHSPCGNIAFPPTFNNFKVFKKEKGGYSSLKNIWNQRKKYR